jgi:hypothetical protein
MTPVTIRAATIGLLLVALTACAPSGSGTAAPAPSHADAGVVLARSGGITGASDTVTVSPDGHWTRSDAQGTQRSGQLTEAQRSRLRTLAASPRLRAETDRPTTATTCRDSFNYAVIVGEIRISYVDCPTDAPRPETAASIVALLTEATNGS